MSASEPPELPEEPSEVVYRRPAWVEIDAGLVLEAAGRAVPIWPDQDGP